MTPEDLRQLVRIFIILILVGSAITTRLITRVIGNPTLSLLADKFYLMLTIMILLRVTAAWLDSHILPQWSLFTNFAGVIFYLYIWYVLAKLYYTLSIDKEVVTTQDGSILSLNKVNKEKLSHLLDEVFIELRVNKKKTTELKKDIENKLKVYD